MQSYKKKKYFIDYVQGKNGKCGFEYLFCF